MAPSDVVLLAAFLFFFAALVVLFVPAAWFAVKFGVPLLVIGFMLAEISRWMHSQEKSRRGRRP